MRAKASRKENSPLINYQLIKRFYHRKFSLFVAIHFSFCHLKESKDVDFGDISVTLKHPQLPTNPGSLSWPRIIPKGISNPI